jgi:hypothetical protein
MFLIVGAAICGIIAFDFYRRTEQTAQAISEKLGLELVSVGAPLETKVAGFLAVVLLVAGVRCLWVSWRGKKSEDSVLL